MKILIVDDSRVGRNYVAKILLTSGNIQENDIASAANGNEALEIIKNIKTNQINLLFLDINMPEMNGITLLEKLQQMGILNNLQVVITSSLNDKERIDKINSLGVKYILKKPFTPEMLNNVYDIIKGLYQK
ncbi:MAG: response regulator [Oligoflexia bacterium]|nr:response regulator [Oligoflexia bacterium]